MSKISKDYTFARSFPMMKRNGEVAAATLIMSEGSTYSIKFAVEGGNDTILKQGLVLKLVNNGNVIASSYNKVTLNYQDGFVIKCEKTGMYQFVYEFRSQKEKPKICGYISVGFKRSN